MTVTLSCLYDDYETARQVVRDLESAGLPSENISIIAKDRRVERDGRVDRDGDGRAEGAEIGAGIGAVLGGTAGLLTGLGMLAIPGIGPVVAAGWLVATGAGALAGGAAGGIIGALTGMGVSREHAHVYAESIRRGATLVTARVPDSERGRYKAIMDREAVNVEERGAALRRSGWKEFDENAPPYAGEPGSDLASENARLRRLVADLSLENQALKDQRIHRP
jgi:hypothetical protein